MIIKFPKNIKIDLNNIPDDFENQIKAAFADYTNGTSKDFTYQDKLAFIDKIVETLHHAGDEWDAVKEYLHERFEFDLDNGFGIPDTSDYDGIEALEEVYRKGREDGRLYYQFVDDKGFRDHHVYDKIMELEYRAIKAIMGFEWSKNEYKRGWCDALSMALKEAYTIHSEEGIFQVIQAETLIGLGYAIDEFGAESEVEDADN